MTAAKRGPGGSSPDPSVRTRVLDAFVQLVEERGLADTSVDDVAKAAGVSKTTLYTRWPDRRSLIIDGFRHVSVLSPDVPDGLGFVEMLDGILSSTADDIGATRIQVFAEIIAAAGIDAEIAAVDRQNHASWTAIVEEMIERGKRSGHVPTDRDTRVAAEVVQSIVTMRQLHRDTTGAPLRDLVYRLLTEDTPY